MRRADNHTTALLILLLFVPCAVLAVLVSAPRALAHEPKMREQDRTLLGEVLTLLDSGGHAEARARLEEYLRRTDRLPERLGDRRCSPVLDAPNETKDDLHGALLMVLGNARYLADDLSGSYDALCAARALTPDSPGVRRNLALAALGMERWEESAELLEEAAEYAPAAGSKAARHSAEGAELMRLAALSWHRSEKAQRAARAIAKAVQRLPRPDADHLDLHAHLHTLAGRHAQGIAPLRAALEQHPADATLWLVLADAEQRAGHAARAIAALETVLELRAATKRPEAGEAGDGVLARDAEERLERLYEHGGLPGPAALRVQDALARSGQDASRIQLLERLAAMQARAQRPLDALHSLERAQELRPEPDRLRRMAALCLRHGLSERAARLLAGYLRQRPHDDEARLWLALCRLERGETGPAREALLAITPGGAHHDHAARLLELLPEAPDSESPRPASP